MNSKTSMRVGSYIRAAGFVWLIVSAVTASAQVDQNTVWPLCGRIAASPPAGWVPEDGCPLARAGDSAFSDAPFAATFGPRPLASEGNRYDFHRGVDLATPIGTPIFAITDGIVMSAGPHPSYSEPMIRLRHFRPGETTCSSVGCYNSLYLHLSGWVVTEDDVVTKGQLIGYTGASSASGFEHLHFSLRDAPASDPYSSWSRDSVHPFRALPYQAHNDTEIQFVAVDTSNPEATVADVSVVTNRFDFASLQLRLKDSTGALIPQPGNTATAGGYHVLPSFLHFEQANFQYSHKNSSSIPWSSFGIGGANECPYADTHGSAYSAGVHLDASDPQDVHTGLFNGIRTRTAKYWPSDVRHYELRLEFTALRGPASCIQATAAFVSGDTASASWGECDGTPLPTLTPSLTPTLTPSLTPPQTPSPTITLTLSIHRKGGQVKLAWSGAQGGRIDVWRGGQLIKTTRNDGNWSDRTVSPGTTYVYRVCEQGSLTACSTEEAITP